VEENGNRGGNGVAVGAACAFSAVLGTAGRCGVCPARMASTVWLLPRLEARTGRFVTAKERGGRTKQRGEKEGENQGKRETAY